MNRKEDLLETMTARVAIVVLLPLPRSDVVVLRFDGNKPTSPPTHRHLLCVTRPPPPPPPPPRRRL